jgi:hypothetical protein
MSAEDAGTIYAEIRLTLTQMEKDGLDAQKAMDELANKFQEKGKKGGEMYVKGFGKGQQQLNKRLNDMVANLKDVSPKMGAMGDKIAKVFSKPIFAMVPTVSAAFQAMLPVIGSILAVIGVLFKAISAAAKKQKEFNDNVKLAKQAQDALVSSTKASTDASKKQNEMEERKSVAMAKVRLAFNNLFEPIRKLGETIKNFADKVIVFFLEKLELITKGLGIFMGAAALVVPTLAPAAAALLAFSNSMSKVEDADAKAAVAAQKLAGVNKELITSVEAYEAELKNLEIAEKHGVKTAEEAAGAKASAADSYLQKLIELRNETVKQLKLSEDEAENNPEVRNIENTIAAIVQQRDEYAKLAEAKKESGKKTEKTDQEKITEARRAAIEKYEQAVRKADDAHKAGLIDEIELQKQKEAALAAEYADMEAIVAQYKLTTGETVKMRDSLAEQVKLNQDIANAKKYQEERDKISIDQQDELKRQLIAQTSAKAQSAKTEEEKNRLLDDAIDLENELIQAQRDRAREVLEQSDAVKNASKEVRDEILADFDKITEGMKKVRGETKTEGDGSFLERLFGSEKAKQAMQFGEAALDSFNSIADASLEIARNAADRRIAIIEDELEETLKNIEKERNARLIAAGFAVENNAESLEAQLEAAKRTGDEVLIYQTERRLEEQRINDQFDEEAKKAKEEAEREKAQLEYNVAVQEYRNKIINAVNSGIMAVINALSTPGIPWPLAAAFGIAAGISTGAQIAALKSNPPQPPKFANSGIVPGNSYHGDRVNALVDSGELILNRAHQDNIAEQLTSNGTVNATIVVMLDGRDIAKTTVDMVNDGYYTIKARAVR